MGGYSGRKMLMETYNGIHVYKIKNWKVMEFCYSEDSNLL